MWIYFWRSVDTLTASFKPCLTSWLVSKIHPKWAVETMINITKSQTKMTKTFVHYDFSYVCWLQWLERAELLCGLLNHSSLLSITVFVSCWINLIVKNGKDCLKKWSSQALQTFVKLSLQEPRNSDSVRLLRMPIIA